MRLEIYQLRRGRKNNSGRDDWANYEKLEDHIKPQDGEIVLEYNENIPRLKIGDGIKEFSELPYMYENTYSKEEIDQKLIDQATNTYSKEEIDSLFTEYVVDIDALIGEEESIL